MPNQSTLPAAGVRGRRGTTACLVGGKGGLHGWRLKPCLTRNQPGPTCSVRTLRDTHEYGSKAAVGSFHAWKLAPRRWGVVPWLLSIMRSSHGVYSTLACQALLPLLDSQALRGDAITEGAGPALANCLRGKGPHPPGAVPGLSGGRVRGGPTTGSLRTWGFHTSSSV